MPSFVAALLMNLAGVNHRGPFQTVKACLNWHPLRGVPSYLEDLPRSGTAKAFRNDTLCQPPVCQFLHHCLYRRTGADIRGDRHADGTPVAANHVPSVLLGHLSDRSQSPEESESVLHPLGHVTGCAGDLGADFRPLITQRPTGFLRAPTRLSNSKKRQSKRFL